MGNSRKIIFLLLNTMMKFSSVCFVTACLLSEKASAAADNAPVRPHPYTITFVGASNNAPGNRDLPGFYQDISRDTPLCGVNFPLNRLDEDSFQYRGDAAIRRINIVRSPADHQLRVSLLVFPRADRGFGWTWHYEDRFPEKLDGSLAGEYTLSLSDHHRQRADCAPDTLNVIIAPNPGPNRS